jgi:hypothetical protein
MRLLQNVKISFAFTAAFLIFSSSSPADGSTPNIGLSEECLKLPLPYNTTPLLLPYAIPVANFKNSCLGNFITTKHIPSRNDNLIIQVYGKGNFPSGSFEITHVWIGSKIPKIEPLLPLAIYTVRYSDTQSPPELIGFSFPSIDSTSLPSHLQVSQPTGAATPVVPIFPFPTQEYEGFYPVSKYAPQPYSDEYKPYYNGAAAAATYEPPLPQIDTVVQPSPPALIAHLSVAAILSEELSSEQIILIDHCGTMAQKFALVAKLKAAQEALKEKSIPVPSLPPAVLPSPTPPPLTVVVPQLSTSAAAAFPPLTKETQALPTPKPALLGSRPQELKKALWSEEPLLPAPDAVPKKDRPSRVPEAPKVQWLPECSAADRNRYATISQGLQRNSSDYAGYIILLQNCDPHTSGYLPHLVKLVNRLNSLNWLPKIPAELAVLQTLVSQAAETAPASYCDSLKAYLTKREQQKRKEQKEEEERVTKETEEKRKREEEQKKQAEEAQKAARLKEENKTRIKAAREKREQEIATTQEALLAKSGKSRDEQTPEIAPPTVRRPEKKECLSRHEQRLIARAEKAGAAQKEEGLYASIASLLDTKDYTQALEQLEKCEKNSRRFVNLLLNHLLTLEARGTPEDNIQCKKLVLTLLTGGLKLEKPLTAEEKIALYTYLQHHSADEEERMNHLKAAAALGDPVARMFLSPEKAEGEKSEETTSPSQALIPNHVQISISAQKTGYIGAIREYHGQTIAPVYEKRDQKLVLLVTPTIDTALLNLKRITDADSFNAQLTLCLGYLDALFTSLCDGTPETTRKNEERLIRSFLENLKGHEQLLLKAMELLILEWPGAFVLLGQQALLSLPAPFRYECAKTIHILISALENVEEKEMFQEQDLGLQRHLAALHTGARAILDQNTGKKTTHRGRKKLSEAGAAADSTPLQSALHTKESPEIPTLKKLKDMLQQESKRTPTVEQLRALSATCRENLTTVNENNSIPKHLWERLSHLETKAITLLATEAEKGSVPSHPKIDSYFELSDFIELLVNNPSKNARQEEFISTFIKKINAVLDSVDTQQRSFNNLVKNMKDRLKGVPQNSTPSEAYGSLMSLLD